MVLVFVGLSAIVATAMCRTWGIPSPFRTVAKEETGKNGGTERVLGPNEFLPQILAKDDVTASVIRGEMQLIQAATTFRDLSTSDPNFVRRMSSYYPDADEIEIYARSVISHVQVQLRGKPGLEATIERLQAQLSYYQEQSKLNRAG